MDSLSCGSAKPVLNVIVHKGKNIHVKQYVVNRQDIEVEKIDHGL